MSKIKNYENNVYAAVTNGELEIDSQGHIWRIAKRGWDRWNGHIRLNLCRRVRAEHRIPLGYLQVRVMFNKQRFHASAHRVVYLHFFGQIPLNFTVNHKNGVRDDNRPENLELVTYSGQQIHSTHILQTSHAANQNGEKNYMAKLTDAQVAEIRQRRSEGDRLIAIAEDFGVTFQTISKIALGQRR